MIKFAGGKIDLDDIKRRLNLLRYEYQETSKGGEIVTKYKSFELLEVYKRAEESSRKDFEWTSDFTGDIGVFFVGGGQFYTENEHPYAKYYVFRHGVDDFVRAMVRPVVSGQKFHIEVGDYGLVSKESIQPTNIYHKLTVKFKNNYKKYIGILTIENIAVNYRFTHRNNDVELEMYEAREGDTTAYTTIRNSMGDVYIDDENMGESVKIRFDQDKNITFFNGKDYGVLRNRYYNDIKIQNNIDNNVSVGRHGLVMYYDRDWYANNAYYGTQETYWWNMNPFGKYDLEEDYLAGMILLYKEVDG